MPLEQLERCLALAGRLAIAEWASVFTGAKMTIALLNRLSHHSDTNKNDSWR